MAKKTLLEITQDILNDLDSDAVNSINDTVEALQVAQIVRTSYDELMNTRNWPHLQTVSQLTGLGDITTPTKMGIPDLCKEIITIRYNKRKITDTRDKYHRVTYKQPDEFLDILNTRDSSASTVQTVTDYDNTKLYVRNDKSPEYWTSFDDENIVFDSFDNAVDSTLQGSKTQVMMYRSPVFTFSDTFIPDLPEEAFSNLIEEAKSTAFVRLKQVQDGKSEQKARRTAAWLSRKAWKAKGGIRYPDFGRKT